MKALRLCLAGLFVVAPCLLFWGCAATTPIHAPSVTEQPWPESSGEIKPYQLRPFDRLGITFWGNSELDQDVTIRPDGYISLPFVDEVQAVGLMPSELDAELTRLYAGELTRPEITVVVRDVAPQTIHIGGEVRRPGPLNLMGPLTLFEAIQEAGGLSDSARRHDVLVIRIDGEGVAYARSVDLRPVLSGADPSADLTLQPQDLIFVPRVKITHVKLFVERYILDLLPLQPFTVVRTVTR